MDGQYSFAVWYLDDYSQIDYELFKTEEEAARAAIHFDGDGTVLGLQLADGSTVPHDQWRALADARRRWRQLLQDQRDNPPTPVPTRRVRDPFMGREIDVEETEPDWLGHG